MVTIGTTIKCPKCGKESLEREERMSSHQFREECSNCGYFREATWGFDITEEELVNMHFKSMGKDTMYVREGFIKKSKKFSVINTWFSSPSDIPEKNISWIEASNRNDLMTVEKLKERNKNWKKLFAKLKFKDKKSINCDESQNLLVQIKDGSYDKEELEPQLPLLYDHLGKCEKCVQKGIELGLGADAVHDEILQKKKQ